MTKLSVNINKIATLRNARGHNLPDIVKVASDIQAFGGQGITIHPRPDERHITRKDVYDLKPVVNTEFNIEGNPTEEFIKLVLDIKPEQVTLVPDAPDAITSNAGWDTVANEIFLKEVISEFKNAKIRTSIFIDTDIKLIDGAKNVGADRIELYTEKFATEYNLGNKKAIIPYAKSAIHAYNLGMGINAGHDLSLDNIEFFKQEVPYLNEVSIGHALISEALYLGLENTVQVYLSKLK